MSGPNFSQTHGGSGDNIINFGPQPFRLTDADLQDILNALGSHRQVFLVTVSDQVMGDRLQKFLQGKGIEVVGRRLPGNLSRAQPHRKPIDMFVREDGVLAITMDPT